MFLDAGDYVSADGRIIDNFSLQVNESSLTGESDARLQAFIAKEKAGVY